MKKGCYKQNRKTLFPFFLTSKFINFKSVYSYSFLEGFSWYFRGLKKNQFQDFRTNLISDSFSAYHPELRSLFVKFLQDIV